MNYYKITIQYEGTNYSGFQWQNGLKTVQSEFNTAVSKCLEGKFTTMAASRTDTGVHALEQIVKISSENIIQTSRFVDLLNASLPNDIRCLAIEICDGHFKPAAQTSSKEYRYFFTNQIITNNEDRRFISNISNQLNIELMQDCVEMLNGQHDFCNFYSKGSNVLSSQRIIFQSTLKEINPHLFFQDYELFSIPEHINHCYQFQIIANGFLKQMIRHIVSALWQVGTGKISKEEFLYLLEGPKSEKQLWKVASPNGLFLCHIKYKT